MVKNKEPSITMYNPYNNVKINTNKEFQSQWEKLGFKVIENVILFKIAV